MKRNPVIKEAGINLSSAKTNRSFAVLILPLLGFSYYGPFWNFRDFRTAWVFIGFSFFKVWLIDIDYDELIIKL
jgi:hypothetical protein